MTIKQKILKEIDSMPDKILQLAYRYIHSLNLKHSKRKAGKGKQSAWEQLTTEKFLEGYSDKDAAYDRL